MDSKDVFDQARVWWSQRTALEKAALIAAGSVVVGVAAVSVATPGLLASTVGGALAGAGGWWRVGCTGPGSRRPG